MARHKLGQHADAIAMNIPTALIDLGETHSALRHPAGEQAVIGKGARLLGFFTVERPGARGFVAHVGQFGNRGLHAKRHLVFLNARVSFWIAHLFVRELIDSVDAVDQCAPRFVESCLADCRDTAPETLPSETPRQNIHLRGTHCSTAWEKSVADWNEESERN